MPLKIKSQSVFTTYYIIAGISSGELEEKTYRESYVIRNENGLVSESSKFLPSGALESLTKFEYDAKGNKIEELHYISENEISERRTFKYDENNLLVAEFLHYLDGSFDKTIFVYDEKNKVVEKRTYDDENTLESKVTFHYENELLSEATFFDSEDVFTGKEIFIRDLKGNIVEKLSENQDNMKENILNQYNDSGHLIKSFRKNNFEKAETVYKSDIEGNIIEESLFSDGKLTRKTVFIYNSKNLLQEMTEYFSVPGFSAEQKIDRKVEYSFY